MRWCACGCVGGARAWSQGPSGFQLRGAGVDRAPWLDPPFPQKGLNCRDPQNPTKIDPLASEVTQAPKSAKNENGIFGISASRGPRKIIICHTFGEKKLTIFNAQKIFGAKVACQLSRFPKPPLPPDFGGSIDPPPPPHLKTWYPNLGDRHTCSAFLSRSWAKSNLPPEM